MKKKLPQYLNDYFNNYLCMQKNLSTYTISSYKDVFNAYFKFCTEEKHIKITSITLDTFTYENIMDFLKYLETAKNNCISTRNHRLQCICSFLRFVYPDEVSRALQFQKIFDIPPKKDVEKPMEYMTVEVLKLLLQQPNIETKDGRRDLAILATLYDTGARVSELTNLKVRDIRFDLDTTTIRLFGKGRKVRYVPIIGNTADILRTYIHENNLYGEYDKFLFVSKLGKPLTKAGIKYIIEKYRKIAEQQSPVIPKNIYPHMFRHSKAMHLLESGVNFVYIRDFLGHCNVETTEIYAKISVEQKRKVLSSAYQDNTPSYEENSWTRDKDLLEYLMKL